ncbi:serine/threonine-protein kinase pdik1l-B-like [Glandiceps talaboti]
MLDRLPFLPPGFEKLNQSDIMTYQPITPSLTPKGTKAPIDMAKYNKIGRLRRGAFGEISLLKNRDTGEVFAGKKLKCDAPSKVSDAMNELFALAKLDHNNIVRIAGVHTTFVHDVLNIWLVMEYCPHGTLNEFILQGERLRNNTIKRDIMKQLADAVSFLHEKRIVHRDLKPENILMTMKDGQIQAKVADFGLAKVCESLVGRHLMTTFCGTEFFMAPEVFGHSYTEKADVFSLGVIFFALIEKCTWQGHLVYFFRSHGRIMSVGRALRENPNLECRLKEWFPISRKLKQGISSMLSYDEIDRPSAMSIFRMLRREAIVMEQKLASPVLHRKVAKLPKTSDPETESSLTRMPHPPPSSPRTGVKYEKLPRIDKTGMVANTKYIFKEKLEPWKIKVTKPPSYLLAPRPPPPRQVQKNNGVEHLGRPHTASRVPRPPAQRRVQKNLMLPKISRPHTAFTMRFPQPPNIPKPDMKVDSVKGRRPLTAARVPHPPKEPKRNDRLVRLMRPRTGSLVSINRFKPPWKP